MHITLLECVIIEGFVYLYLCLNIIVLNNQLRILLSGWRGTTIVPTRAPITAYKPWWRNTYWSPTFPQPNYTSYPTLPMHSAYEAYPSIPETRHKHALKPTKLTRRGNMTQYMLDAFLNQNRSIESPESDQSQTESRLSDESQTDATPNQAKVSQADASADSIYDSGRVTAGSDAREDDAALRAVGLKSFKPQTDVPQTFEPQTDVPQTFKPQTDVPQTFEPQTNVAKIDASQSDLAKIDLSLTKYSEAGISLSDKTDVSRRNAAKIDASQTDLAKIDPSLTKASEAGISLSDKTDVSRKNAAKIDASQTDLAKIDPSLTKASEAGISLSDKTDVSRRNAAKIDPSQTKASEAGISLSDKTKTNEDEVEIDKTQASKSQRDATKSEHKLVRI